MELRNAITIIDFDKIEFGSHWFYHEDLDEGQTVNRGWATAAVDLHNDSSDESEDFLDWGIELGDSRLGYLPPMSLFSHMRPFGTHT